MNKLDCTGGQELTRKYSLSYIRRYGLDNKGILKLKDLGRQWLIRRSGGIGEMAFINAFFSTGFGMTFITKGPESHWARFIQNPSVKPVSSESFTDFYLDITSAIMAVVDDDALVCVIIIFK